MRIVLWDQHPVVLMALTQIVRDMGSDWEPLRLSGDISSGLASEALEALKPFDLVICDPRPSSFYTLNTADMIRLKAAVGDAPLLIFTASEHPDDIRSALGNGASAYIPKTTDVNLLGTIIRLVHAGGLYVPPSLAHALTSPQFGNDPLPGSPVPADRSHLPSLTLRQHQVLHLLSEGLSNAEIGERLHLNISTVKSHVTSILKTLGVERRTQAVLLFKQAEWNQPPA